MMEFRPNLYIKAAAVPELGRYGYSYVVSTAQGMYMMRSHYIQGATFIHVFENLTIN